MNTRFGFFHRSLWRAAIIQGTVNEPTTFPAPNRSHGSYHWAFERLLAASLLPLTGAAFATSGSVYPVLDGILGVSLIMHSHIGVRHSFILHPHYANSVSQFDSILVDYIHKRKFPKLAPAMSWALRTVTVGVLVGVYQFNTQDIGTSVILGVPIFFSYFHRFDRVGYEGMARVIDGFGNWNSARRTVDYNVFRCVGLRSNHYLQLSNHSVSSVLQMC